MSLRRLLAELLRSTARGRVRQEVVQAAKKGVLAAAEDTARLGEQPQPCEVGLVFALKIEADTMECLLERTLTIRGEGLVIRQGRLKGRQVAVVRGGAGRTAAARATEALLSGHRPQWVIAAGFAGGLSPRLKRHDVLMADRLVDPQGGQLSVDLKVDPAALAATPGVHVGTLLTADQIVRWPQQKQALGQQHGAVAVDMESYAVAEVCRRCQVRFLAIRVVNDPLDEQLPADVEKLLAQRTTAARLGAAAGAIWRRPSSAKEIFRLRENALEASGRLAKFLCAVIEQLPDQRSEGQP